MTTFNKDSVLDFIVSNMGQDKSCAVCSSTNWIVFEDVYEIRAFNNGGLEVGPNTKVIPLVVLMCNVCGHTVLFNAIAVKAVDRKVESITKQTDGVQNE